MKVQKKILEILPEILREVRKDFENDESIREFFQTEDELKKVISVEESVLSEYLKQTLDEELTEDQCITIYRNIGIPYPFTIKFLKSVKKRLILKLKNGNEGEIVIGVDNFIDELMNKISKMYLKKDAHKLRSLKENRFKNYLLFKHHIEWTEKVIDAVEKDNIKDFPIIPASKCEFSKVMEYPEALMVCIDVNLCNHLHQLHNMLHTTSNTFYRFYVNEEFAQAYVMFKDFVDVAQKFFLTLKDLYHITYADLEGSFFNLVEALTYSDKKQIITLIDIKGLKQLNSLYGEKVLNEVLDETEKNLKELVNPENTLIIRGISANFYMLNLNIGEEEYKALLEKINEALPKEYPKGDSLIKLEFIKAGFELDSLIKYTKDELIRIMLHIKEKAKQTEDLTYTVFTQEEKENIRNWINQRYLNISFIEKKFKEKEIEPVFQPIVSVETKQIYGVETLARIKDGKKLISAGLFIDTIYEINKVVELDILILEKLKDKMNVLEALDLEVFINASPRSLENRDYRKHLEEFAKEFGKTNVVIEITEQEAFKNIQILKEFHKNSNLRFAIDDFGTGYTALKMISELAMENIVSVLKIDGEIIKMLEESKEVEAIVEIISNMCKVLEIKSLAEYVENLIIFQKLEKLGIDLAQGYFLGKPMKAEELLTLNIDDVFSV